MSEQQAPAAEKQTEHAGHQAAAGFDPARYLTKLSRRQKTPDGQWKTIELDYMEVKWRLLWLRSEHPDAEIATELATLDLDRNLAVFKAHVAVPGRGSATGWGSETADDWRDFIEKAETKALGRALAALGFGTQFCEDFDFGGDEGKVVDAPVDIRSTRGGQAQPPRAQAQPARRAPESNGTAPVAQGQLGGGAWTDRPATEPQIKAIYAIARGAQAMDDGTLEEWVRSRYHCLPAELNRRQASEAIDALKLGAAS
ncbi:MAG TPA: hypothetical protein VKV26_02405 [Dehalococcoidia bacterium]|nr:hypothetical protein [Dehalococcoidia bacterium]